MKSKQNSRGMLLENGTTLEIDDIKYHLNFRGKNLGPDAICLRRANKKTLKDLILRNF